MAFTNRDSLQIAWQRGREIALREIRPKAVEFRAQCVAGPAANLVVEFAQFAADKRAQITTIMALPGLLTWARNDLNDQTREVLVELQNIRAALDAVTARIILDFPTNAAGRLTYEEWVPNGNGQTRVVNLPSAAVAALVPLLDTLIATID